MINLDTQLYIVGKTGAGKTELLKMLNNTIYFDMAQLLKLDSLKENIDNNLLSTLINLFAVITNSVITGIKEDKIDPSGYVYVGLDEVGSILNNNPKLVSLIIGVFELFLRKTKKDYPNLKFKYIFSLQSEKDIEQLKSNDFGKIGELLETLSEELKEKTE